MTESETKRYGQCADVLNQTSRTDGEKAAARNLMSRIDAKLASRTRVRNAYTMSDYARTLDIVA